MATLLTPRVVVQPLRLGALIETGPRDVPLVDDDVDDEVKRVSGVYTLSPTHTGSFRTRGRFKGRNASAVVYAMTSFEALALKPYFS